MISKKKYRYKPVYKKFVSLRKNIQNRSKILKFKKRKWQFLISQIKRLSKTRKNNCYYKFYDQSVYKIVRYNNFFTKNYKQNLMVRKSFNLFYGNLSKKLLKKCVSEAVSHSNQVQNKVNSKKFFSELFEKRLDVILMRSHFTSSIMSARQLISHGHVKVNNMSTTNASVLLNKGDVITFSKKSNKLLHYYLLNSELWPLPPQHLQISYRIFQIAIVDDVKSSNNSNVFSMWLNLNNVIESYKR
jgi:small subunit ribosomal protein S4